MVKDMTKGTPWKLILGFMVPVCLGSIFQNFYTIVDSMIVGRFLGVDALAAVGSTGSINFLVMGWINGMTSGFGIQLSQAFGANDEKRLKHYMAMSVYLCIGLGALMTIGLLVANTGILQWMNTPELIFADTAKYIGIIYAGLPVTILYNMLAAVARSLGDSKTPLYFLIISSVLNIVLDLFLIAVIPLGVAGAAYATVLAQAISAILCLVYVWKKFPIIHYSVKDAKIKWQSIYNLLAMGIPMGLQFSITAVGTMIVQASLNTLGATYIAAYSATMKIQNIVTTVYPSLGAAIATFSGQNYGAGKYERINKGVNACIVMEVIYSIFIMIFSWSVLPKGVQLFAQDPTGELQMIATQMFRISMWFFVPLGIIFIYRNVLQGLGNGFVPMLGGVFELIARALVIKLFFDAFKFTTICASDPAAWVSALIPLIPYYYWFLNKTIKSADN
ncbi:MAG: MATE family efflux transporter [Lachnospiraceae bacterium]|nr:MATE family efflux transporter [Lachnospiraceae bacterium]